MGEITYYAKILIKELKERGIKAEPEYHDGYKSVDLFIEEANLVIEVDGSHHTTNPEQALTDLKRAKYSLENGCFTYHLPNTLIYKYPSECADLVKSMVVNLRNKKVNKKVVASSNIPVKSKKIIEEKLKKDLLANYPLEPINVYVPNSSKRKILFFILIATLTALLVTFVIFKYKATTITSLEEGFDKITCDMDIKDIGKFMGNGMAWMWSGTNKSMPVGFKWEEGDLKLTYYGDYSNNRFELIDVRLINTTTNEVVKINKCFDKKFGK